MDIKYDIYITESAYKDLDNIYFYISDNLLEETTATNIISELKDTIFSLETMPGRFGLVSDSVLAKKGYRHINVKNYIILYLIDKKKTTVTIARIIHARIDYSKIFN